MARALIVAVLGLVLGIVVPFLWSSSVPVLLGAALLALAGVLARRAALVVAGIVAAVVLALAPGLVNRYRNGRGVAWTVPAGERLRLAQDGLAVTLVEDEPVLRGRDVRTGARKWELRLPDGDDTTRLWRVGPLLLTTSFDDTLRAVDASSGKVLWASPGEVAFIGVSDGEHLALTRCPRTATVECEAQSLSLADGRVAWRAPADGVGRFLGVPLPDGGALQRDVPPWPASFALLTDAEGRWAARDLGTGRELATGTRRDGATAMLGDVLVRATDEGAMIATNVQTGARAWTRAAGEDRPSRNSVLSRARLAVPEGFLILSRTGDPPDSARLGERLRLLDVRTGTVSEHPVDVDHDLADVLASDRPTGARPVVFWREYDDDSLRTRVIADGRVYDRVGTRDVDVAPGLVGFGHAGSTWGTGLERVYEVFDRRSGQRIVRYAGEDVTVSARGDVLVLREGDDDDAPQHVIVSR